LEGHHNFGLYAGQVQAADPQFISVLQLLRALQQAKITESEIVKQTDRVEIWIRIHPIDPSRTGLLEQLAELKMLLGIPAKLDRVKVVFGIRDPEPAVIGLRTRSLMQILSTLGAGVQIQQEHLTEGGVIPMDASQVPRGFTVHSGKEKPDKPFAAVPYDGLWFWIDRRDLASKTTLSAVTVLFNFLEGGEKVLPVLTIPTN
jgi:hypothetical protein